MTAEERPVYVVFAGVNGAGKSTFYHSGMWRLDALPPNLARVNPDEIAREIAVDDGKTPEIQAGKIAVKRIGQYFDEGKSFNQETTLSGHSSLRNIKRAHDLGYRVFLFYIGVQTESIAIERIAHRVAVGGHDIGKAAVRRRFASSMRNFSAALPYCEEAFAIDNTRNFSLLARWRNGMISWWGNPRQNGLWLIEALCGKEGAGEATS